MECATTLAARAGAGCKPDHFDAIVAANHPLGFFEVHAENYMGAGGRPHRQLSFLRENYALSIHGVGLSIGGAGPLDRDHIARLKQLCDLYQPESFSEHLAWSSHGDVFLNDLLPLPYTQETLALVAEHVDEVQTVLRRQMLLENPATYLRFESSTIPETEYLTEIAERTGCGLLLDVNNVFVSCRNHGSDPYAYLADFPLQHVGEIHLAGHFETEDGAGNPLLIDAHGSKVADPVRALFTHVIARTGPLPVLIEWDNDVPDWPVLRAEALAAQAILESATSRAA